ncbi:CtsR family transcriptional regulator [Anaerococcus sp. AGMB09787]|uniref:CtsR family transcriptional regulator n=1 Tax=Anaerococcus sp. AGMB09787 TaxID=2922869 RepID=UPI001FAEC78D|nr:CtsR family transcriptional regulator [Anaerococcus sp. AGMB09787]
MGDNMALTSDIEDFLKAMLEATSDGMVEIGRNELAVRFDCAPSQINYVLSTRFTPLNGYIIESKRGGNGFIKIMTIVDEDSYIPYLVKNLKKEMSQANAESLFKDLYKREYFSENEYLMAKYATSDRALASVEDKIKRKALRSDIIKYILLSLMARS